MRKCTRLFAAVSASAVMLCAGQSLANPTCHRVHVEAVNTAVDPLLMFGKYAGTAMISVDGQPAIPAGLSMVPHKFKIDEDGTVHPTTTITFDLGPMGTLSVQDNAILSPTSSPYLYIMNSRLDNLVGTGMFAGAMGKLSDHGQFNFATSTITATADGKICW